MEGYCLAGIFRERKESGRACIYRNGCTESELSRNTASERGAFSSEIRNSPYHILDMSFTIDIPDTSFHVKHRQLQS